MILTEGSSARIFDAKIKNNTRDGVRVVNLSVAKLEGNAILGNTSSSLFCDAKSHASGDLSNADPAACPGFEQSAEPALRFTLTPVIP